MTCDFNDGWLFQKEGQPGESVDLPHDAMKQKYGMPLAEMASIQVFSREENMSIPNIGKLIRNG